MRVITGTARGTVLKTPAGMQTRPTAERVKEALFSALHYDLPGMRVLDLFAGTGQLGIEALSRGAPTASLSTPGPTPPPWCRKTCAAPSWNPPPGSSGRTPSRFCPPAAQNST